MCSYYRSRASTIGFSTLKLQRKFLGFPSQCSRSESHHVFLWRVWREKKFPPKFSINLCLSWLFPAQHPLALLKFEIKVCYVPALGVNSIPREHKQKQGGDEGLLATPCRRSKTSGVQVSSMFTISSAPFTLMFGHHRYLAH